MRIGEKQSQYAKTVEKVSDNTYYAKYKNYAHEASIFIKHTYPPNFILKFNNY